MLRRTDDGQVKGANLTSGRNNSWCWWRITGLGYSRNNGLRCTRTCKGRKHSVGGLGGGSQDSWDMLVVDTIFENRVLRDT
jgi:hypothetical protein